MQAIVTYTSKANPFDSVLIKPDDSFVIVGDHEPTDEQLQLMVDWEDVDGYEAE